MRVTASIDVHVAPEAVWALVSDPERVPEFMAGVTRWECVSDNQRGVGARYRVLMQVGSAPVGGLIEVVEYDEPRDLAWTSVTGIDHRGRWRLRKGRSGTTCVTLRLSYAAAGGVLALVADRVSAP